VLNVWTIKKIHLYFEYIELEMKRDLYLNKETIEFQLNLIKPIEKVTNFDLSSQSMSKPNQSDPKTSLSFIYFSIIHNKTSFLQKQTKKPKNIC
jgi:hypothetical protein